MIILKVTKNQGFSFFAHDTFFEKPKGQVKLTPPNPLEYPTDCQNVRKASPSDFHC